MRRDAGVKCLFLNIALVRWEALAGKSTTEGLRIAYSVDDFYYLARATLVKDERNFDKFDRLFGHHFKGSSTPAEPGVQIPEAQRDRAATAVALATARIPSCKKDMGVRHKAGHDDGKVSAPSPATAAVPTISRGGSWTTACSR